MSLVQSFTTGGGALSWALEWWADKPEKRDAMGYTLKETIWTIEKSERGSLDRSIGLISSTHTTARFSLAQLGLAKSLTLLLFVGAHQKYWRHDSRGTQSSR